MHELPLDDASVALVICSLALTHVPDLVPSLLEFRRVLRPGGRIVLTDVHPILISLSGQAQFRDGDASRKFIRNEIYWPSDYLRAFRAAGLAVEECLEAPYSAEECAIFWTPESGLSFDTVTTAFAGLPAVLCWRLAGA